MAILYSCGSTVHIEVRVVENNMIKIGSGLKAVLMPLEDTKIVADFPPKIDFGMRVKVDDDFYRNQIFEVIGIDKERHWVWLKGERNETRIWVNPHSCNIIA